MKFTLLGTGTSNGVPVLGCGCEVCRSDNPKDKRMRCALLVESDEHRVLVDCGPDIRMQLMPQAFRPIDAVLLTHIHHDHVGGIDDLRPYCSFGDIHLYGNIDTVRGLKHNMPYCFSDDPYPGVPLLKLHAIESHHALTFGDIHVMPLEVLHGQMPIMAYRFGKLAYITDMKAIRDEELQYLQEVEVLVINALRFEKEHHSHQLVSEAIAFSRWLGVRRTILTHLTHQIGLHEVANKRLPRGVEFGYDGMQVEL